MGRFTPWWDHPPPSPKQRRTVNQSFVARSFQTSKDVVAFAELNRCELTQTELLILLDEIIRRRSRNEPGAQAALEQFSLIL